MMHIYLSHFIKLKKSKNKQKKQLEVLILIDEFIYEKIQVNFLLDKLLSYRDDFSDIPPEYKYAFINLKAPPK